MNKDRCCKKNKSIYRKAGYRLTIPRETILNILSDSNGHLSAEDLYNKVNKINSGIGLTTVYRTLELLSNIGVVNSIDFGDGKTRYELANEHGGKQHHHHLVCTQCCKIINYSDFVKGEKEALCSIEKQLEKKHDFAIKRHSVIFYGICGDCK